MTMTGLKVCGTALTLIGGAVTLLSGFVEDAKLEKTIDEKVDKKFAEKEKEEG